MLWVLVGCKEEEQEVHQPTPPLTAEGLRLRATSLREGDTGVPRDLEIRLLFDADLDADSVRAQGAVRLIEAEQGTAVPVEARVASTDPRLLVVRPRSPPCLRPDTRFIIILAPWSMLGGGIRDLQGHALRQPWQQTFTTGVGCSSFQVLDVDPAPGERRWIDGAPTVLTVRFSGPLSPAGLAAPLGQLLEGAGGAVPLRWRTSGDPSVLQVSTREPLPPGAYRINLQGFSSLATGEEVTPWSPHFHVEAEREVCVELSPPSFRDARGPVNLAPSAQISGWGLHGARRLVDGHTAASGGRPAWLQTDGLSDASQPSIRCRWDTPVEVGLLVVDTDDHPQGARRMLGRYRVSVREAPGRPWLPVSEVEASGDHTVILRPALRITELRLSHCRVVWDPIWVPGNPLVYELGIYSDPDYRPRSYEEVVEVDLGASAILLTPRLYEGETARGPRAEDCGASVLYEGTTHPPGPGRTWTHAGIHPLGSSRYLRIRAGGPTGIGGLPLDLRWITLEAERVQPTPVGHGGR